MSFWNFFTRTKISTLVDDQLYEAERARLNALAQLELARAAVLKAKAELTYNNARIAALRAEQVNMQARVWVQPAIDFEDSATNGATTLVPR